LIFTAEDAEEHGGRGLIFTAEDAEEHGGRGLIFTAEDAEEHGGMTSRAGRNHQTGERILTLRS
jgi:hypothetical protein